MSNPFSKLWAGIREGVRWAFRGFRDPQLQSRFKSSVEKAASLAEHALPAARAISAMTPTPADDVAVAAVDYWLKKVRENVTDADNAIIGAAKLILTETQLRQRLIDAVRNSQAGIEYAGQILKTVEDVMAIPTTDLRNAAQLTYSALKEK